VLLRLVNLFSFLSVVLRADTLVFQSVVLGGVLFVLWIARVSHDVARGSIGRIQSSTWRLLRISAVGLAVVQLLYLYVNSAVLMATAEIGFDGVVGANFFISGSVVLTAALLIAMIAGGSNNFSKWAIATLALVIVGASVMTNHAASRLDGRPLLITLSCIHELATGFWIGGLPFLALGLYRAKDLTTQWHVTERFSRVALISAGALLISGAAMSVIYIGSWAALMGTAYGVMVTAKATMLAAVLLLGGVNFLLIRNASSEDALPRLRRLIEAELGIGITLILTAASLTSQPPAIDQISETVTLAQIYQRFKPTVPRLTYKYVAEAASNTGASAKSTLANDKVLAHNIDGYPLTSRMVNDSIESESNHHWMGLVVLAMGLLAVLARAGRAQWAEYWPLLLIGIAVFIFLQADTECWPVGWKGFEACWADPEVFQHRIAALVCLAFGVFEARVRKRRKENDPLALVFPLMVAVGGAVLLTHSHAITNVKENLLAELSHVLMGVLAVFAGWARWLELRLPEKNRVLPSWIWPVCFVLIGATLLNYREM
jgi:putative copper resistance protein D